jgi:hypothetical protein
MMIVLVVVLVLLLALQQHLTAHRSIFCYILVVAVLVIVISIIIIMTIIIVEFVDCLLVLLHRGGTSTSRPDCGRQREGGWRHQIAQMTPDKLLLLLAK